MNCLKRSLSFKTSTSELSTSYLPPSLKNPLVKPLKPTAARGIRARMVNPKYRSLVSVIPMLRSWKALLSKNPHQCAAAVPSMSASGLYDESEMLTVIPKKFLINRQLLVKYRCCQCPGKLVTCERPPRIKPGSSYSDAFIIDVALSKYCDLIPIERYCSIAGRSGFKGLPQNSLIELTHYLAHFLEPLLDIIKQEVLDALILYADETPHKMLESKKKLWYLWGFSSDSACFFYVDKSRSGDVAHGFLSKASCEILLTDVYSAYGKAVRLANDFRKQENLKLIIQAFCNAHARRRFVEINGNEGQFFIDSYEKIYGLEKLAKEAMTVDSDIGHLRQARDAMKPIFDEMKSEATKLLDQFSSKSSQVRAAKYFIDNFDGLILCLDDLRLRLDNKVQEGLFRSPVVGRKTWHGNHSVLGAKTTTTLHTVVECCKLNKVNPRKYIPDVVKSIHVNKEILTPSRYRQIQLSKSDPPH